MENLRKIRNVARWRSISDVALRFFDLNRLTLGMSNLTSRPSTLCTMPMEPILSCPVIFWRGVSKGGAYPAFS